MKRFKVLAGWMDPELVIGVCDVIAARGKELISFSYDIDWLKRFPGLIIDPDIAAVPGRQYPPEDKPCFGFLADATPDRWGRKLMERRERLDAAAEKRPVRKLLESDYILGVQDNGRLGGLRFLDPDSGNYFSARDLLTMPPMTKLPELEQASLHLEQGGDQEEAKWLRDLTDPGSSLGGARPKANVMDREGNLWIAKFPSRNDVVNIGAWEMVLHDLASKAGINVPEARHVSFSDVGDTFLVKRFDRNREHRIHFASAMTMLGTHDGSTEAFDYVDIAGVLERIGSHPQRDLAELWARAVFNICTTNADNHLRNHGFLLVGEGWRLSPAFDVNPTYDREYLEISIGGEDRRDIHAAIEAADFFRLSRKDAIQRAREIQTIIRNNWKKLAPKYHLEAWEIELMRPAFMETDREL